ncbi:2,3-bisphosphoglycerate-dependent phosphoglycerate mutase [Rhodoligotrophos appendicifer]|uniref:2,3-bisphosphoglycerate-dependent phosphoglycerate mutase n=1 Tax=Rhodoligotrophos appendicifer TaxID=987056 RepID=UPI0014786CFB|nr:2,3-bisphosphoglycerate-dependent phosphoglycerate mutase [Rhodoligotrophos appendicifer]
MRHGESEGNRGNIFTGGLDLPLTDDGRIEAKSTALLMKEAGVVFDRAFSSDLVRALESAEIVVASLGGLVPLEARSALQERNYGTLAGRDKYDVLREFGRDRVQQWRRSYTEPPPGGESLKDTLERVRPFFEQEIGPLLLEGLNVLVVAHGSSLRALIVLIEGRPPRQIGEVEIATGDVVCYCVVNRS